MRTQCHCGQCADKLCLQRIPIFSSLSENDITRVTGLITHHIYKKGETLMLEGDKTDSIVIIHEGSAKAYKNTSEGREQILYVFTTGDFFGEQNLFRNQYMSYSVEALDTIRTCHLSKEDFQDLLLRYPEIALKIIDELGSRMSRLENALQTMGVRNVDTRISETLLEFANKYGTRDQFGTIIRLPLSREGMANYLGVARETLSRKFSQLESDGVIKSLNNKEIQILNSNALLTLAGVNN